MTKKHFIALANVMRTRLVDVNRRYERSPLYHTVALREVDGDVKVLADFCAAQNPRFDRELWLAYIAGHCGPNGGKL
jgi:hypothetical protein